MTKVKTEGRVVFSFIISNATFQGII